MKQRLQKYLAQCGVASRRKCEQIIQCGEVTVNGHTVTQLGSVIDSTKDIVAYRGKAIHSSSFSYWALNKPPGVICSCRRQEKRQRVIDFFSTEIGRIYPVGRLDVDSEGLIFLTNDGSFCNSITHPSFNISKTYIVWLNGRLTRDEVDILKSGVIIDSDHLAKPVVLTVVPLQIGCKVCLQLNEGRNREIRKIFDVLNKKVVRLRRIAIGPVELGNLKQGVYRKLTDSEVKQLIRIAQKKSN